MPRSRGENYKPPGERFTSQKVSEETCQPKHPPPPPGLVQMVGTMHPTHPPPRPTNRITNRFNRRINVGGDFVTSASHAPVSRR